MKMRMLSAFLLGGAVGASLGVLFAPDKGSITRKNIMDKKDQLVDEADTKVEEGKDYVKTKYKEGKSYVKNRYEEGKEKLHDVANKAREKADGVADDYEKSKQPDYSSM